MRRNMNRGTTTSSTSRLNKRQQRSKELQDSRDAELHALRGQAEEQAQQDAEQAPLEENTSETEHGIANQPQRRASAKRQEERELLQQGKDEEEKPHGIARQPQRVAAEKRRQEREERAEEKSEWQPEGGEKGIADQPQRKLSRKLMPERAAQKTRIEAEKELREQARWALETYTESPEELSNTELAQAYVVLEGELQIAALKASEMDLKSEEFAAAVEQIEERVAMLDQHPGKEHVTPLVRMATEGKDAFMSLGDDGKMHIANPVTKFFEGKLPLLNPLGIFRGFAEAEGYARGEKFLERLPKVKAGNITMTKAMLDSSQAGGEALMWHILGGMLTKTR